jgi:L-alanine-DL-glutamate epimerase-like enolase superfamily enzyme
MHAHSRLCDELDTQILQTEHIRGLELHTDFIANGATDLVRADPEYDVGITGAMKIGRVAEGFGLDVEYHAPGPASRHCMAATRKTNYYEVSLVHPHCSNTVPPVYASDYSDDLETVSADGTVPVPNDPGLGVEYDWDFIRDHQTGNVHIYQ